MHFDPYDPTLQLDPYPTYQWLRDESPADWDPGRGFWTLSRFEDVWSAVHDPLRLSSAQGIVIGQSDIGASNLMEAMPMMIMMDPPRHDELRRLVSRAFTPRAIAQMENAVRCTTRQLLEDLPEGRADLLPTFAGPLPVTVIAEMLGVPVDDRENFREWSDMLVRINPDEPESVDRALHGSAELFGYLPPLIQARRRKPKDDLLSAMVAAEHQGRRMTDEEIAGTAFLLLTAGNETTTNLIANMAMIVGTDADLRRTLIDDPSLIPAAAEEVLRLESPVQGLARTADRGCCIRRRHDRGGPAGPVALRSCEQGRAGVPPRRLIVARSPERSGAGVRPRNPLLPRRDPRPARGLRRFRGAPAASA